MQIVIFTPLFPWQTILIIVEILLMLSCFYFWLSCFSVLDNIKGAFSKLRETPKFQEYVEAKKLKGESERV